MRSNISTHIPPQNHDSKANTSIYNARRLPISPFVCGSCNSGNQPCQADRQSGAGSGFSLNEVKASKKWPLLGTYVQWKENTPPTEHQDFLRTLTLAYWREYSDISHGTFQGLMKVGIFYVPEDVPHEQREKTDEASLNIIFGHMARAAAILLCILTELQAYFRFDGARINPRIHEVWNELVRAPEIKDLYLHAMPS
jgi:hypothetical protein